MSESFGCSPCEIVFAFYWAGGSKSVPFKRDERAASPLLLGKDSKKNPKDFELPFCNIRAQIPLQMRPYLKN